MYSGTEQAKAKSDILATSIRKSDGPATTHDVDLGFMVQAVRDLEGFVASGGDGANTARTQAHQIVEQKFELRELLGELNRIIGGRLVCVAEPFDAELIRVQKVHYCGLVRE